MTNYINKNYDKIREIILVLFFITSFSSLIYLEPFLAAKTYMKYVRYISYILLFLMGVYSIFVANKGNGEKNDFKALLISFFTYIKNHVVILISFMISLLIFIISKHSVPLILWIFGLSLNGCKIKRVLKLYFYSLTFIFLLTLLMNRIGIIPSVQAYRGLEFSRDSLGFIYPLETQTIYLFIGFGIIYFTNLKYKLLIILALNIFNYLIYIYTDSRFSFFLFIFISFLYLFLFALKLDKKLYKKKKLLKLLSLILVIFCFVIFPLLCYFYSENNTILNFINSLSSRRLYFAQQGLENYGLSLFGKNIDWIGFGNTTYDDLTIIHDSYNFIDCSYVKDLLDYGLFYYILIAFLYWLAMLKCIKYSKLKELILVSLALIISLSEARLLQIALNPALLLVLSNLNIKNKTLFNTFLEYK